MPPFMTHLAYHVEEVSPCIEFYEEFCQMKVTHRRKDEEKGIDVVWLAEEGKEKQFIIVLIGKGQSHEQRPNDFGHVGFAVKSKEEVDRLAKLAKEKGSLFWEPREDEYPAGYYCGIKDPNGNIIEFSYGQPLGPGSPDY